MQRTLGQPEIAPLVSEINHLKNELSALKAKKLGKGAAGKDRRLGRVSGEGGVKQRVNQEISELEKRLGGLGDSLAVDGVVQGINSLISWIQELCNENSLNILPQPINQPISHSPRVDPQIPSPLQEQLCIYREINGQLQRQNKQLKKLIQQYSQQLDECLQQKDQLVQNLQQKSQQLQQYSSLRAQTALQQAQQKLRIFENTLQKKQSQLVLYQEDIQYLTNQNNKLKQLKKDSDSKLLKLQKQLKQQKSMFECEVATLEAQVRKWRSQCEGRRDKERENILTQDRCQLIQGELQGLREEHRKVCQQVVQSKNQVSEKVNQNLRLEEKLYKVENQNQKLKKNLQFCKKEISFMNSELLSLKSLHQRKQQEYQYFSQSSNKSNKNLSKKQRETAFKQKNQKKEKMDALQQIRNLIRKQKQEDI